MGWPGNKEGAATRSARGEAQWVGLERGATENDWEWLHWVEIGRTDRVSIRASWGHRRDAAHGRRRHDHAPFYESLAHVDEQAYSHVYPHVSCRHVGYGRGGEC